MRESREIPARIRFAAGFREVGVTLAGYTAEQIKAETQFFRSSLEYVQAFAGPITTAFVRALPEDWLAAPLLFDSWSHHLKPGQTARLPSVWHMDDVARSRPDGQPEHQNPPYRPMHRAILIGDVARPRFLEGQLVLEDLPIGGGNVYEKWDRDIEMLLRLPGTGLKTREMPPSTVVEYGWGSFHKATPALSAGWRIYIRVARGVDLKASNLKDVPVPAYSIV